MIADFCARSSFTFSLADDVGGRREAEPINRIVFSFMERPTSDRIGAGGRRRWSSPWDIFAFFASPFPSATTASTISDSATRADASNILPRGSWRRRVARWNPVGTADAGSLGNDDEDGEVRFLSTRIRISGTLTAINEKNQPLILQNL